jgi:hypothetical protein
MTFHVLYRRPAAFKFCAAARLIYPQRAMSIDYMKTLEICDCLWAFFPADVAAIAHEYIETRFSDESYAAAPASVSPRFVANYLSACTKFRAQLAGQRRVSRLDSAVLREYTRTCAIVAKAEEVELAKDTAHVEEEMRIWPSKRRTDIYPRRYAQSSILEHCFLYKYVKGLLEDIEGDVWGMEGAAEFAGVPSWSALYSY